MTEIAALVLADGRFPSGAYAHSGGLEAAVAAGSVHDRASLAGFLEGRLRTVGVVDAWLAAAACAGEDAARLEAECEARCPSPALRAAGRAQGRGLRRAAAASWPSVLGTPERQKRAVSVPRTGSDGRERDDGSVQQQPVQQQPVVLGLVARAAGLTPLDAATLVLHGMLSGGASAAVRLLALDMADAMAIVVSLGPLAEELAAEAAALVLVPLSEGPAWSAPSLELRAEDHARWEVRLFAS